ncbi:MAG: T9SS type A sorting domain-containing protein [Bacteroidota bacterium]
MKTRIYFLFAMIFLAGTFFTIPSHATTHTVLVGNYYFNPANLNVTVGDTVKWVWVAGSHTTTSGTIPAGAASWDHLINSSNQTYSYAVTVAGVFNYVCTPHASMGMVGSFTAASPNNTLAVAPANQNVSSAAGNTSFTVTSNTSWNASCDMTWCTCTPSGTGNGTITATYTENTTHAIRTTMITVTASGVADQTVMVTQAASTTGLSDQAAPLFLIYPNPVISKFWVASESLKTSETEVSIYNISGMKVFGPVTISGSPATVDVSRLPDGVYFVRTGKGSSGEVSRIVKTQ